MAVRNARRVRLQQQVRAGFLKEGAVTFACAALCAIAVWYFSSNLPGMSLLAAILPFAPLVLLEVAAVRTTELTE